MHAKRSISEPLRYRPDFDTRWRREDGGLITAWETGRKRAIEHPELAEAARNGALPRMDFDGGHDAALSNSAFKYGTMHYLAQLQGLKGEDLDVDSQRDEGLQLRCEATGMLTIFTADMERFK